MLRLGTDRTFATKSYKPSKAVSKVSVSKLTLGIVSIPKLLSGIEAAINRVVTKEVVVQVINPVKGLIIVQLGINDLGRVHRLPYFILTAITSAEECDEEEIPKRNKKLIFERRKTISKGKSPENDIFHMSQEE